MRERRKDKESIVPQPAVSDSRRVSVTVVSGGAPPIGYEPFVLLGQCTANYMPPLPRPVSRDIIRDENHVSPRPPRPPRKMYSRVQRRWMRKQGLWPPPKYRAPWKRRVTICDGPVIHDRVWTKHGGDMRVTFTPKPSSADYLVDEGLSTERTVSLRFEPSGRLSYDPGLAFSHELMPPEGYQPWLASESWERGLNLARRNALENFLPKLGVGFQGILALLEGRELGDLATSLRNLVRWNNAYKWRVRMEKFWRAICQAAVDRSLGRQIANYGLLYQFGLMPLVDDLKKFFLTLAVGKQQLANFLNHANSNQISHCQESIRLHDWNVGGGLLDHSFDTSETFLGIPLWGPGEASPSSGHLKIPYVDRVVPSRCKYHLTVRWSCAVPDLGGWETVLLAMEEFGLGLNVTQLWAHIPFSFLVDWVVPVSAWLEEHVDSHLRPFEVHIASSVESIQVDWQRAMRPIKGDGLVLVNDLLFCPHEAKFTAADPTIWQGRHYSRRPIVGLPVVTGPPLRLPRGMKWVSAGLLIVQRS